MAQNSSLYNNLCRRIKKLETFYLPTYANPFTRYTKKDEDNIRAYSLLVHAELESYFEGISKKKAIDALNNWLSNHRYNSLILLSLSCFVEQTQRVKQKATLEEKLRQIVGVFCETIKNNNGIKEINIKELLIPIGVRDADLDSTWLNTLNSFGSKRGEFAHTGAAVSIVPNHNDIKQDVQNILGELKTLDKIIKALK